MHSHCIYDVPTCSWAYVQGAVAHCLVWGSLQLGALSPVLLLLLAASGRPTAAALLALIALLTVLAPVRRARHGTLVTVSASFHLHKTSI